MGVIFISQEAVEAELKSLGREVEVLLSWVRETEALANEESETLDEDGRLLHQLRLSQVRFIITTLWFYGGTLVYYLAVASPLQGSSEQPDVPLWRRGPSGFRRSSFCFGAGTGPGAPAEQAPSGAAAAAA